MVVSSRPWALSPRFLLGIYAVVPLALAAFVLDSLFFDHRLRAVLPQRPEDLVWWTLIFNLPHIMASHVTFADRTYLKAYARPLWRGLAVCTGLSVLIPMLFGFQAFLLFLAFYTMYHVLMQQYGLSLMLMKRPPDRVFQIWRWLSVAGCGLGYASVYFPVTSVFGVTMAGMAFLAPVVSACSLLAGGVVLWRAWRAGAPRGGLAYFAATLVMVALIVVFYVSGYWFLMVAVPRFVHDVSAFAVYVVHDHNRNRDTVHNFLYRPFLSVGIPVWVMCPVFGIGFGWLGTHYQNASMVAGFAVVLCALMHYYMESVMWKRGSPHRQQNVFATLVSDSR